MSVPDRRAGRDPLEELERLTRAQLMAARAEDMEGLKQVLGLWQQALEELEGGSVPAARLREISLQNQETRALLEARLRDLEQQIQRLCHGGRALQGYVTKGPAPPGFLDEFR